MTHEGSVYIDECAITKDGGSRTLIICPGSVSRLSICAIISPAHLSMPRYETRSRSPYPYPSRPPSTYTPTFSYSDYHQIAPPTRLRPLPRRLDSGVDISSRPGRRRHVLVHPERSEIKDPPPRPSLFRRFVCGRTRARS
jgi:hypothetical protein